MTGCPSLDYTTGQRVSSSFCLRKIFCMLLVIKHHGSSIFLRSSTPQFSGNRWISRSPGPHYDTLGERWYWRYNGLFKCISIFMLFGLSSTSNAILSPRPVQMATFHMPKRLCIHLIELYLFFLWKAVLSCWITSWFESSLPVLQGTDISLRNINRKPH